MSVHCTVMEGTKWTRCSTEPRIHPQLTFLPSRPLVEAVLVADGPCAFQCIHFLGAVWSTSFYLFISLHCVLKVKVTQPCLTLCDLVDYTVHGILQARVLEWAAFPFSRVSSQTRDRTQVSRIAGGCCTN